MILHLKLYLILINTCLLTDYLDLYLIDFPFYLPEFNYNPYPEHRAVEIEPTTIILSVNNMTLTWYDIEGNVL